MKKQFFIIAAFSAYKIFNDKTIVKTDGTRIVANGKGKVTLLADADDAELKVENGKKYTYNIDDLIALGEGKWQDSTEAEDFDINAGTPAPVTVKTPEEIAEEARKTKSKELKAATGKASSDLLKAMAGTDKDAIEKAGTAYREALEAQTTFEAENKPSFTAEQQATIDEFEGLKAERDEFRGMAEKHNEAMKLLKEKLPTGYKPASTASGTTGGDAVPQRAPKLNYDIAQAIREDVGRNGMSKADAAKKYGVTVAAINYICIYEHYKLKEGGTDFMAPVQAQAPAQS